MTLSLRSNATVTDAVLGKRLFDFASRHAERFGYEFGNGAAGDMHAAAASAASTINLRVRDEKKPEKRELYVRQAESAFGFLVERMIFEALTNKDIAREPGIIGERTYERARALLCPCWPICGE
ncbi:hypothetical protein [Sinorhizobium medicae]|uniref:hypothetical protein n=1 Tax=Sinorhizobium medicae TaxID=110321 RepID=UPI000FD892C5|nr:hypothetical protein [Sinorhizobium medicae]RVQ59537.1 hypothetical protein CN244_28885 [Sinorhizobium medicae]